MAEKSKKMMVSKEETGKCMKSKDLNDLVPFRISLLLCSSNQNISLVIQRKKKARELTLMYKKCFESIKISSFQINRQKL